MLKRVKMPKTNCLLMFKMFLFFTATTDNERLEIATKKFPLKYARPVVDWLQEKGKLNRTLKLSSIELNIELFLFVFSC